MQDIPLVIMGDNPIKKKKSSSSIDIAFKNLSYVVKVSEKNKNTNKMELVDREILKGISGLARSGEVTAIMGASGAGKTSLLNLLSCQIKNSANVQIKGNIQANGQTYTSQKFNKFAGYVMQTDILSETLTPRESLMFAANLRLNISLEDKVKLVKKLLSDLKLERAADTYIGGELVKGISGGERKRASVGVELITDPSVLFLDEPTSGLDSFTAFVIINLLKNRATIGKTIIFTIHQPSSDIFDLFDSYMVLSKGKFIYQGPGKEAVDYFVSVGYKCPDFSNPADYIMDIAHTETQDLKKGAHLFENYDEKLGKGIIEEIELSESQSGKMEIQIFQRDSRFVFELVHILRRSALNFRRNPILFHARFGQIFFMAFLCCSLYFQLDKNPDDPRNISNRVGAFFFLTVCQWFLSMMPVLLTFPAERALFLKEQGSNMYSVSSYFFGRSLVELPAIIFFPVIWSLILYWIIGFNNYNAGKFFIFTTFMVLQSIAGNAMGLMAGCMFNDPKVASGVAPLFIMPAMIFGGMYINDNLIPVWLAWMKYISPFYYMLHGLCRNEFFDSPFDATQIIDTFRFTTPIGCAMITHFLIGLLLRSWALINLKYLVRKLQ